MTKLLLVGVVLCALGGVAAADATVAKDSIRFGTQGASFSKGAFEKYGWKPWIAFRVNGPVQSGSQLYVEVGYPGAKKKLTFDCPTSELEEGRSAATECRAHDDDMIEYAGTVDFSIRLRNELSASKATLFSGKAKVEKKVNPKPSPPEYWVNDDWMVPIGYVFFDKDNGHGDDVFLNVAFGIRGNPPEMESHLYYKGKDLAKCKSAGNSGADWNPNKPAWGLESCAFLGVYPTKPDEGGYDPKFDVSANPGEYEIKVLLAGHLARSIKFKVGADGKLDKSLAVANKLGSDKALVPVQILGNRETAWDKSAWKAGAFYGNPLSGFAALPPK
jgi:hypothetical protein